MGESFEALSATTGIALPATLRHLIESGRTGGDDPERTALSAVYDFEWLSAQRAGAVIAGWLNPVKQHGNVFLPFGRSGAGDAYCLVRLRGGEEGIAMVWRDCSASRLRYASFDHFVVAEYLAVFADLDLLDEDAGDPVACLRADIAKVADLLDPALQGMLHGCLGKPPAGHPYQRGSTARSETMLSLISQVEEEALYARVSIPEPLAFDVVARWEA
ncbi:SMI1/KNR4 family protein [Massilia sp. CCM 8695]|uniref:SMI1/KNR4 family protein n=1 Tax=Massilia frigida TaxID=2609281 RepID=A0ABX0N4I8_9BURK|nr:SMI1/KNR4 family protein [Massilia frigida]NHZ80252.1 SMI1/KNR4 family protein [Massilia frigida]